MARIVQRYHAGRVLGLAYFAVRVLEAVRLSRRTKSDIEYSGLALFWA